MKLELNDETKEYVAYVQQQIKIADQLVAQRTVRLSWSLADQKMDELLPTINQETQMLLSQFLANEKLARVTELRSNLERAFVQLKNEIQLESIAQDVMRDANDQNLSYFNEVKASLASLDAVANRMIGIRDSLNSSDPSYYDANQAISDLRQVHQELGSNISVIEHTYERYTYISPPMSLLTIRDYAVITPVENNASSLLMSSNIVWGAAGLLIGALVLKPAIEAIIKISKKTSTAAINMFHSYMLFGRSASEEQAELDDSFEEETLLGSSLAFGRQTGG